MTHFTRILSSVAFAAMLGFFISTAHGQGHYGSSYPGGVLEYSLPLLTSVPPIDTTMASDVVEAYLWLDELMRTATETQIDNYIWSLNDGDTLQFLAKLDYEVIDHNALSFYQWNASAWQQVGRPPLPWLYQSRPGPGRIQLQNQISVKIPDTARTGFLLACDIISDVTVSDTFVVNATSSLPMVFVNSTINDEIKGQQVPLCVGEDMRSRKKAGGASVLSTPSFWPTYAVPADTGTCLDFEYSPEWQRGIFTDEGDPLVPVLSDSSGWWVRPGGEYIVFLYINGVNKDSVNGYFTIDPFWGVFGSQGAIYRVIGGIVQDPNDDFGIGSSAGLPVDVWKTRLRARIYNILHPRIKKSLWLHQQFIRRNFQPFTNFHKIFKRHVHFTSFTLSDVIRTHSATLSKSLLTNTQSMPIVLDIFTYKFRNLHFSKIAKPAFLNLCFCA